MRIRHAEPADLDAIARFDPFGGDRVREIGEKRMLVATVDDIVVGFASWLPDGFVYRTLLSFVAIAPAHRRQGFAGKLIAAVEQHVSEGRLFISTEQDNRAMLMLLTAGGWTLAGLVEGANGNGVAEVFFYKDLASGGPGGGAA